MLKGENNYCTFSIKEFIKNLCVFLYSFLLFGFFTVFLSCILSVCKSYDCFILRVLEYRKLLLIWIL